MIGNRLETYFQTIAFSLALYFAFPFIQRTCTPLVFRGVGTRTWIWCRDNEWQRDWDRDWWESCLIWATIYTSWCSAHTSTFWARRDGLKLLFTTTFTSILLFPTSLTKGITRNGKLMSFVVRYLQKKRIWPWHKQIHCILQVVVVGTN